MKNKARQNFNESGFESDYLVSEILYGALSFSRDRKKSIISFSAASALSWTVCQSSIP